MYAAQHLMNFVRQRDLAPPLVQVMAGVRVS